MAGGAEDDAPTGNPERDGPGPGRRGPRERLVLDSGAGEVELSHLKRSGGQIGGFSVQGWSSGKL